MKVRVSKRGVLWSCCDQWKSGDDCQCEPFIVEFFDSASGTEVFAAGEGPRRGPEARP